MAALRAGIKTVIIPKDNEKDLAEIDQTVRRSLNFILADHVDKVIDEALTFPAATAAEDEKRRNTYAVPQDTTGTKAGIRQ